MEFLMKKKLVSLIISGLIVSSALNAESSYWSALFGFFTTSKKQPAQITDHIMKKAGKGYWYTRNADLGVEKDGMEVKNNFYNKRSGLYHVLFYGKRLFQPTKIELPIHTPSINHITMYTEFSRNTSDTAFFNKYGAADFRISDKNTTCKRQGDWRLIEREVEQHWKCETQISMDDFWNKMESLGSRKLSKKK
jgi:hypothetical protein